MISVNLVTIATGRYRALLPRFLGAAEQLFCADFDRRIHVFADRPLHEYPGVCWRRIAHEPWPGCTLHRYARILEAAGALRGADYTYWADADLLFVRPVGDDVFSHLAAVIHPGYEHASPEQLPYETRLESTACVLPRWRRKYYQNSFAGGRTELFLQAAARLREAIAADQRAGIVARWHDESHWNRYLLLHPPTLELSPDYSCYPDFRAATGHPGNDRLATRKILHVPKQVGIRDST